MEFRKQEQFEFFPLRSVSARRAFWSVRCRSTAGAARQAENGRALQGFELQGRHYPRSHTPTPNERAAATAAAVPRPPGNATSPQRPEAAAAASIARDRSGPAARPNRAQSAGHTRAGTPRAAAQAAAHASAPEQPPCHSTNGARAERTRSSDDQTKARSDGEQPNERPPETTRTNNRNTPPLLAFAGARARKGFSRCRSSGARAQEAATAEPAAPLPRPAVQLKDLAGGLLPGERSSGFPVADGGVDRLVVGGTRFRERGARHDGRRSGRRAGRKGQAPQRQCQPLGAAPPPGAKGMHTASARGGHPAPQPTGDAGEGAPSGGGGARRGRTRDKTQKLPPVFWFFPCFFLLFL